MIDGHPARLGDRVAVVMAFASALYVRRINEKHPKVLFVFF